MKPNTITRVLVFIVAYNAEKTILSVLQRIPQELIVDSAFSVDVLIIDDCSQDKTVDFIYKFINILVFILVFN